MSENTIPPVDQQRLVRGQGQAVVGDTVEWTSYDPRRGIRKYRGVVTGENAKRNTHLRVKTEKGTRYVNRAYALPVNDQAHATGTNTKNDNDT